MIGAIVLAAGESRRMKRHKMLLPLGNTTILRHIVDQLLESVVDEVIVVSGHQASKIQDLLEDCDVQVVHNEDYREGMLSSVRRGLQALDDRSHGVMIALGDQPSIRRSVVDLLVERFHPGRNQILLPEHGGRTGHPLLFDASYCPEIMTSYDDSGLRGLMKAHPRNVTTIAMGTDDVLRDMDYPADYARERRAFESSETRLNPR